MSVPSTIAQSSARDAVVGHDAGDGLASARRSPRWSARWSATIFLAAFAVVAAGACLLAGWFPLGTSIVTVFLFAGPHNWAEARYMLSRMPARWGPLRPFFLTGLLGAVLLTAAFAALPALGTALRWSDEGWLTAIGAWNSALVGWIGALAWLRSKQNPRRDWAWIAPVALVLVALNWLSPPAWDLALVYLHPLVALWFLDGEIRRRRPEWKAAFRLGLSLVPALLACLWWRLRDAPPLPGDDVLTRRIVEHAGAGLLAGVPPHLLVSTHVFLEMLHYAAWIVLMPLVALGNGRWRWRQIPLARRSTAWRRVVGGALTFGALAALALWAGFLANYPLTRDIYFTVAMLHVLAEVPFLLRLL